jgi:exopolysaccharide biosynthesis protein
MATLHRAGYAACLLVALCAAASAPALRADATVVRAFVGVSYIDRTESVPRPWHAHIAQIELNAPGIRFKLSPPAGSQEVVRQSTLEFLEAEGAQVAINAHYFWPWPSADVESSVIGLAASDGRVYSSFERPVQSYALVANAAALNIDKDNRASIVHPDPAQSDGRHIRESVTLWNAVAGSAQIVTDSVVTIPQYRDADHPNGILTPGVPNNYSNANSWYEAINARTAIGLSCDRRTVTLFTVDARGGSQGLRVSEVAQTLVRDYGVCDALNLDGGGSTSMAMEDPVTHIASLVNSSSDNPSGRAVGSSLAVFARRIEK